MAGAADAARAPALVVAADRAATLRAAALLFPGVERLVLARHGLRPADPFRGSLFERLATLAPDACVALVVPVVWRGLGGEAAPAAPDLIAVADHVNLELRGPLTGRWPAGVPRSFPALTRVYQPGLVRAAAGPRVYSSGVVVAGVADAGRLTPFEASVVRERRIPAVADCLVPSVIIAAYYGLSVAACGVPQSDDNSEK